MPSKLSKQLRAVRLSLGYSLRDVERLSKGKISNAYVSIAEHGIERPKPETLRILCKVYQLDFISMMKVAGHIKPGDISDWRLFSHKGKAL